MVLVVHHLSRIGVWYINEPVNATKLAGLSVISKNQWKEDTEVLFGSHTRSIDSSIIKWRRGLFTVKCFLLQLSFHENKLSLYTILWN